MTYDLENAQDREDRRKHLDIVQGVIARQAASSAATKGWAVTLAVALFGVAVVRGNAILILLGLLSVAVMSVADAFYLHNEQRFRDLYDAIVENQVVPFSMDLGSLERQRSRNRSYWSWSVAFVYGPVLVIGVVLLVFALANVDSGDRHDDPPPRHEVHHES